MNLHTIVELSDLSQEGTSRSLKSRSKLQKQQA